MNTIVDTDALLGIANPQDVHHFHAKEIFVQLEDRRAQIILLPTTLCEFSLLATSRIGMEKTKQVVMTLQGETYTILPVTESLIKEAFMMYQKQTSKEESLFDCYIMVAVRQFHTDCIFSFDQGYTKNGLVLAEDYFKVKRV